MFYVCIVSSNVVRFILMICLRVGFKSSLLSKGNLLNDTGAQKNMCESRT